MREITVEELSRHRLFLASPQFGGVCTTIFAKALSDLAILCTRYGLLLDTAFFANESLVTRARNFLVEAFLKSPANHLMFIDADIGFKAQDVLELLILQIQNPAYDIIGGPYKKKTLEPLFAYNYERPLTMQETEPVQVEGIGTGFMMVRRSVFEKFMENFPAFWYLTDDEIPRQLMQFFQAEIDPKSRRYLSEDYWFSKRCKEIGVQTWLCPWMRLRHAGTYIFE